jgi:hypothetical protein
LEKTLSIPADSSGRNTKAEKLGKFRDFEASFNSWYESGLKGKLDDNRRRYRMDVKDKEEREKRGLSAIPSVKSTATVDAAVERAVMEFHADPDSITFTSRGGSVDPEKELLARWLTEILKYRMKNTFPFVTWHVSSLTAAFADGLEAAFVWWNKESYTEKKEVFHFGEEGGPPESMREITEEQFIEFASIGAPVHIMEIDEEIVVTDSFWIDPLKPGQDLIWDYKAPLLNINLGSMCIVKVKRSMVEMENLANQEVFDKFDKTQAQGYVRVHTEGVDSKTTVPDKDSDSLEHNDQAEIWICFDKEVGGKWMCQFTFEGEVVVSSRRSVNDVFFNGRRVDRLPAVLGTHKMKLWESIGRGEPETIAPLEDELINQKNNIADKAKIDIQGRWRVDHDSDIEVDDLLNARVFYADRDEYDRIEQKEGILDSMRVADSLESEMAQVVPVGSGSKHLVPRGTGKTLGAVQLALGSQNEKLSVQLIVRNETFFSPLLYLLGQMIIAYETDETILRIAGSRVTGQPNQETGEATPFNTPQVGGVSGPPQIDIRQLDVEFDVQINAGLGTAPREAKANTLVNLAAWRQGNGVPTDMGLIARQLNTLAGYDPDAFTPSVPPQPPGPELKGNLNIDLVSLNQLLSNPEQLHPVTMKVLEAFIIASESVTTSVLNSADGDQRPGGGSGISGAKVPSGPADETSSEGLSDGGGIQQGGQGGFD